MLCGYKKFTFSAFKKCKAIKISEINEFDDLCFLIEM